jgi:predicted RNA-binding protein with PUA-like domain
LGLPANPDKYDVDGALGQLSEMTWLVNRYDDQIHAGDQVFLWRSGEEGGIVALATITGDPETGILFPAEQAFIREPELFGVARRQVPMRVEHSFPQVLTRDSLKQERRLSEHSILKFSQGTIFPVSPSEAAVLRSFCDPMHKGALFPSAGRVNLPVIRRTTAGQISFIHMRRLTEFTERRGQRTRKNAPQT